MKKAKFKIGQRVLALGCGGWNPPIAGKIVDIMKKDIDKYENKKYGEAWGSGLNIFLVDQACSYWMGGKGKYKGRLVRMKDTELEPVED